MAEPGVKLGAQVGPFEGCVDADLIERYAAATGDPSAAARAGLAMPPVAIVTQIWDAQNESRVALVSEEVQRTAVSGVHGEHDIVLHRPIVPGEPLSITVEGHGARPAGRNCLTTLHYTAVDAHNRIVAEQWWTTVFLGTSCEPVGTPPPDHAFTSEARLRPAGTYSVVIDLDMPHRYAEVSGDWSAHHFEVAAAQRSGVERPFLHGLCTMALCAQGVVDLVAGGDPERVRRLAVRFAKPALVGEQVDVHLFELGTGMYAFEADSGGATVISQGRAELR